MTAAEINVESNRMTADPHRTLLAVRVFSVSLIPAWHLLPRRLQDHLAWATPVYLASLHAVSTLGAMVQLVCAIAATTRCFTVEEPRRNMHAELSHFRCH